MIYKIKSHPTIYNGVQFRSRLEARWAAFLDIVQWPWLYEPLDLQGWTPDFRVEIPCGCKGSHILLAEVKPYDSIEAFAGHPCMLYPFGKGIPADASAAFGFHPSVTQWQMAHGNGGGVFSVESFAGQHMYSLWNKAGNMVQWRKPK